MLHTVGDSTRGTLRPERTVEAIDFDFVTKSDHVYHVLLYSLLYY